MSAGALSHHFLDDFPQSAALYVLCDEVESLVLVEDSDELEHVGVVQATHDLHLMKQCQTFFFFFFYTCMNAAPSCFAHL